MNLYMECQRRQHPNDYWSPKFIDEYLWIGMMMMIMMMMMDDEDEQQGSVFIDERRPCYCSERAEALLFK